MSSDDVDPSAPMRTPLDSHRRPNRLDRWKWRLAGLALVAVLCWLGFNLGTSDEGDLRSSPGPVANVHQSLETKCSECHVPFTPISSHSWSAPFLGDPHESTKKCQACHEGTIHHAKQKPDRTCGSCHREHRGLEASLVNLPDADCTQCHKDLSKHVTGATIFGKNVARFAADAHPEFRSIKSDPGKLKFNHRLHLTAGMAIQKDGKTGGVLQTLGKIPEPFRHRYRAPQANKDDSAPVQLQCASCHQLDAANLDITEQQTKEFPFALVGGRDAGAYMLPVSYENQCQACHPLTVQRTFADDARGGHLTIPHRTPPKEIHRLLENFFGAQAERAKPVTSEKQPLRPLPGKLPGLPTPTVREWIEESVEHAERDMYLSKRLCAECHYFTGKPIPEAIKKAQAPDLQVAPTQVPRAWLQHAKFNHLAHGTVDCADCHGKANDSLVHADVLIPNRDTCVQCHSPTPKAGLFAARHNCTECHRYHNGDHGIRVEDFLKEPRTK